MWTIKLTYAGDTGDLDPSASLPKDQSIKYDAENMDALIPCLTIDGYDKEQTLKVMHPLSFKSLSPK